MKRVFVLLVLIVIPMLKVLSFSVTPLECTYLYSNKWLYEFYPGCYSGSNYHKRLPIQIDNHAGYFFYIEAFLFAGNLPVTAFSIEYDPDVDFLDPPYEGLVVFASVPDEFYLDFWIDNSVQSPAKYVWFRIELNYSYYATGPFSSKTVYIKVNPEKPTINADDFICTSGGTLSAFNLPPEDLSYISWNVGPGLELPYGENGSPFVKAINSTTATESWVQPVYHMDCGHVFECEKKTVWAGKPSMPTTNPSGYPAIEMQKYQLQQINIATAPGADGPGNYIWWTSGNAVRQLSPSPNLYLMVEAINYGPAQFYVQSVNECGNSISGGGSIYVTQGGGGGPLGPLMIYPNPADSYIELSIDDSEYPETEKLNNTDYTLCIYNQTGYLEIISELTSKSTQLYTGDLKDGIYVIKLFVADNIYSDNLIIKH